MDFVEAIMSAKKGEDLSGIFNALAARPEKERSDVLNRLEEALVPEAMGNITFIQQDPELPQEAQKYAAGKADNDDKEIFEEIVSFGKGMEVCFLEISKVKKENSHTLVKEFLSKSMLMDKNETQSAMAWYNTLRSIKLPKV